MAPGLLTEKQKREIEENVREIERIEAALRAKGSFTVKYVYDAMIPPSERYGDSSTGGDHLPPQMPTWPPSMKIRR